MSFIETNTYTEQQRNSMLQCAWQSISHALRGRRFMPKITDFEAELHKQRACFVTLEKSAQLRGCIGHLEAYQPLIMDVAENAYAAAFRDPRFPALSSSELPTLDLHISVLSVPEPMSYSNRENLLSQLRPGIDGLILRSPDGHQGTFLPSVWESLPQPDEFLRQLARKAGLPFDYWSDALIIERYTTEAFGSTYASTKA